MRSEPSDGTDQTRWKARPFPKAVLCQLWVAGWSQLVCSQEPLCTSFPSFMFYDITLGVWHRLWWETVETGKSQSLYWNKIGSKAR